MVKFLHSSSCNRREGWNEVFSEDLLAGVHGQGGGQGIDANDQEEQVGLLQAPAGPHH